MLWVECCWTGCDFDWYLNQYLSSIWRARYGGAKTPIGKEVVATHFDQREKESQYFVGGAVILASASIKLGTGLVLSHFIMVSE